MDLNLRTETFQTDDQSWLGSAHGTDAPRSITLDTSAFTSGTHYPNGFFPSGLPLGKITATGKYGPYAGRVNEVQRVTVDATGGNITLKFDGETTANISATATAAAMQTALELLSNVQPGDIVVTGGPGDSGGTTPYLLTFGGQWAGKNVPAVVATGVSLTGGGSTVVVATVTAGGSTVTDGTQTLVGHLFTGIKAPTDTTHDPAGAILLHCFVVASKLPIAVDAAGQADVAGRIIYV
jgi:hypothetical protein